MSAVSAGVSEVLIKYTGNVWLQINLLENWQFPIIKLAIFFFRTGVKIR